MDPRTRLDHALFQLTPTRTRCDLVISSGGASEKLASGLLEPFLSHLNCAKDQIQKGGYSITLQPPLTNAAWFTKATLQRFVKFVNTPEVLERFVTIEREISQIESSIQTNKQTSVTTETEGKVLAVDEYPKKSTASTKSKGESDGIRDAVLEESSKVRLQRVLETRRVVLRKEQAMAYARALVAGFETDYIDNLICFADAFGASRLREACINFIELCKKKNNDGLWMDEVAAMQAYSHSEFTYMGNSGIILAGEDNNHNQGIDINVHNSGLSSRKLDGFIDASTMSHESSDVTQDQVHSTEGKAEVPMSRPNNVPQYMHNFPGHVFQQMPPYRGYLFPGMQVAPPYYPGMMQWTPTTEGSGMGFDQEPHDRWYHKSSSRKKEKSPHVKGSRDSEQNDNTEPSDSNSESDSDEYMEGGKKHSSVEQIHRKSHGKRSSRKVVIRNINYITSKGDGEKGSASEGDSSDEHDLVDADSLKQQVEEAVDSLERRHKSSSHNNKKQSGGRHHTTAKGSNRATEQDNENLQANTYAGEKGNKNWDIFQNLLMREPEEVDSSFALNMDSEEVAKPLSSTDSFTVADTDRSNEGKIHLENFEARENSWPIGKTRDRTYEELLYSQQPEKSENHPGATLSDFVTKSSIVKSQKEGDWFPGNQSDKSAAWDKGTRRNIFDGDYTSSFMGDHSLHEKIKKDVLVDDSFMVQARSMDNGSSDSQLKMDIYLVSDIAGATEQKLSLSDNSVQKVETAGSLEPDDLCMVLGRNSDAEQVVASWNPELDYGNDNSSKEPVERFPDVEPADCVEAKLSSNVKGSNSKASGAPGGKALSKEARSKTSFGSLGKSKSEVTSRSKKPSPGTRPVIQKNKSEKVSNKHNEEESRNKMEALRIERQKRISERSAANGLNPLTTKRTSKENKTATVSMKNGKPIQSLNQETANLQKPILRTSTMDRLAAAKVTQKSSSTEVKSSQPRKAISKASGTENKKPGTERVKPSNKQESAKNSTGLPSYASGIETRKDIADDTIGFPVESGTGQATQMSDAIDDNENIKELPSISSEKDGNKVQQIDTLDDKSCHRVSPNGNLGDNMLTSKATPVPEDSTASNGHVQFVPEVTLHRFPPSPQKVLNVAALPLDEGVANATFSLSPEISVVQMSTSPPDDQMATEPMHYRKKWNTGEHSLKATKGFKKLLFFGRKNRNTTTN